MLIDTWYKNDSINNPYLKYQNTFSVNNPIHYYNDLCFRNRLSVTAFGSEPSGIVSTFLINKEYLLNITEVIYNNIINYPNIIQNITSVIINTDTDYTSLVNFVLYMYNNYNIKMNIIIPWNPVFLFTNFKDLVLSNLYVNGEPIYTLSYIPTMDHNLLIEMDQYVLNNNPNAMIEFSSTTPKYYIGYYNNPVTQIRLNKYTIAYYELIDTVPFTYALHIYLFSINPNDPVIHAIFLTHGEQDNIENDLIQSYPYQGFLNDEVNAKTVVIYSGLTQNLYNTDDVILMNQNTLNTFETKLYDSTYESFYSRLKYFNYIQFLYKNNSQYSLTLDQY